MVNLQITYPYEELFFMDDDVSGAFRHMKHALLLIALHTCVQCGYGVMYTGGSFGDCTTPPNFDIFGRVRSQLGKWLWLHCPDIG